MKMIMDKKLMTMGVMLAIGSAFAADKSASIADQLASAKYDRVFRPSEGTQRFQCYRSFDFELAEDGLYAIYALYPIQKNGQAAVSGFTRLWLDDAQVRFLRRNRAVQTRLDGKKRLQAVRCLTKGKHRLDAYAHWGSELWADELEGADDKIAFAIERLRGEPGQPEVGFWVEGKDVRVYDVGDKVSLAAANATKQPRAYHLIICTPEGEARINSVALAASETRHLPLPTEREGEWRWTVTDGTGKAVDGPWSYAVVAKSPSAGKDAPEDSGVVVDRVDCTEGAGGEHLFREHGESKLVKTPTGTYRRTGEKGTERIRYAFIKRLSASAGVGLRPVKPGEKADRTYTTHDWYAYTLKMNHPGKAHILRCRIPNDREHITTVVAYDRKTRQYNGFGMFAGDAPASGPWCDLNIFLWPNGGEVDVMVVNSNGNRRDLIDRRGSVKEMELVEYPDGLPRLAEPAHGWNRREFGLRGEQVNLGFNERTWPDLTAGRVEGETSVAARNWRHFIQAWDRFGQIAAWHGYNLCVYPIHTYAMVELQASAIRLTPPGSDRYESWAQNFDDIDRDVFMVMMKESSKYGVKMIADFMIQRVEAGICRVWADAAGVSTNGMLLSRTADGQRFRLRCSGAYPNPAHPAVRKVYCDFVRGMAERYGCESGFAGIENRFWNIWPGSFEGWFYDFSTGYDDFTVGEFSKATGIPLAPVGTDPEKFAARRELLQTHYRKAWLKWRGDVVISLREEMLAAMRAVAPHMRLLNGFSHAYYKEKSMGSGLDDPRLEGRVDLGMVNRATVGSETFGTEINKLDPACFRAFDLRPEGERLQPIETIVDRDYHGPDFPQGACCDGLSRPYPYNLEPAAKALAENRLDLLMTRGNWTPPAADRTLRDWVRAYRAIPDIAWKECPVAGGKSCPIRVWHGHVPGKGNAKRFVFFMVNKTDLDRELRITFRGKPTFVEDYVTGKANKDFRLPPFGLKVIAVDGVEGIAAASVEPDRHEYASARETFELLKRIRPDAQRCDPEILFGGEKRCSIDPDVTWTFDELYLPIEQALREGDGHHFVELVNGFRKKHGVWFERCGWPSDHCVPRTIGHGALAEHLKGASDYFIEAPKGMTTEVRSEFASAPLTLVPQGEGLTVCLHDKAPRGRCLPAVQALFGGGYGDIVVEVDGKEVGRFKDIGHGRPRLETRVLGHTLLANCGDGVKVTLRGTGPKGMAILSYGYDVHLMKAIREFMVCGPFDKVGGVRDKESFKKTFPPDETVDFSASYTGMNGKTVSWRKVIVDRREKVVNLLKETPYNIMDQNGVSYLVTYIKSPERRAVNLLYSNNYFGNIAVNGNLVVPEMRGPHNAHRGVVVTLESGWNEIRVKSSCGSDQRWHFGLAIDDPGDFEYSATKD